MKYCEISSKWATWIVLLCLSLPVSSASAQFGGRDRGGRGGFDFGMAGMIPGTQSGLIRVLGWDGLGAELQLSEEQQAEVQKIIQAATPDRETMMNMMAQFRESGGSIDAIREEIQKQAQTRLKQVEESLQTTLTKDQYNRLKQISRQQAGARSLSDAEQIEALKISQEQQTKIQEILAQADQNRMELFRLPEDEREKRRQQTEDSLLAVLSEEQRQNWTALQGPPAAGLESLRNGRRGGDERRGPPGDPPAATPTSPGTGPTNSNGTTPAATPAVTSTVTPTVTPAPAMAANSASGSADPLDSFLDAVDKLDTSPTQPMAPAGPTLIDFGVDLLAEATAGPEGAQSVTFNFQFAPWDEVLKLFARIAGLTLDMQTAPPGTFTYYDKQSFTATEALDVLNGYLLQRGFLLVRRDQFLIVANIAQGIPPNLVPTVEVEELPTRGRNELVRSVFVIQQMRAADVVEDVKSLLGPQGSVTAMGTTNRLVVTGLAQNLLRVQRLLDGTAPTAGPQDYSFRAFRLQHIPAVDAEPTIRALLGIGVRLDSSSGSSRSSRSSSSDPRAMFMEMMAQRMQGGGDDRGRGGPPRGGSPSSGSSADSGTAGEARLTVDERTNSLLVAAKQSELQLIEQAIKQIDLPAGEGVAALQTASGPILKVYPVPSGDLAKVAETLMAMVPGVTINQDARANVLHVIATETRQREVATLIRLLDGSAGGQEVAVVPLFNLDPTWAEATLNNMFLREGTKAPVFQTDPYGQNLVVRGSSEDLLQVKALILQMSQTMGGDRRIPGVNSGPVRQIPLQGQDPSQLLPMLQRLWETGNREPLRIIRPGETSRNPDRARQEEGVPSRPSTMQDDNSVKQAPAGETTDGRGLEFWRAIATGSLPVAWQPESNPQASDEPDSQPGQGSVSITVLGDRLILSGQNEEELNALQSLLDTLMQEMALRTQWNVFYLRVADASTTAETLRRLFPDIEVAESTTSTSRLGQSALPLASTTETEIPLRIVPETRSNALFVSGPANRVRELEEVIQLLDSNELPETFRERIARTITVHYASVDEVAKIISEVYADLLPQRTPVRGRGGEEEGSTLQAGQLTLSVDAQNSQLIVSCNESLYRQIEDLVASLDETARVARRTVRVVNLEYADASAVQTTLGTLLPKVTFSTSGGSRVSSSRSSTPTAPPQASGSDTRGSSGPPRESTGSSDDSRRRFFEEMMRRRSEGGDGGGSPFGGRGGDSGRGFRGR